MRNLKAYLITTVLALILIGFIIIHTHDLIEHLKAESSLALINLISLFFMGKVIIDIFYEYEANLKKERQYKIQRVRDTLLGDPYGLR